MTILDQIIAANLGPWLVDQTRLTLANAERAGWDIHSRPLAVTFSLIRSELGEATESLRRNSMDDHLPQYPGYLVEYADTLVRILHLLGAVCPPDQLLPKLAPGKIRRVAAACLASGAVQRMNADEDLHAMLTFAYRRTNPAPAINDLTECAIWAFTLGVLRSENPHLKDSSRFSVDLFKTIVEAKQAFNAERLDHLPENRAQAGGKTF